MDSFLKKENLSKFIYKERDFAKKILRTKQGIFILIVLAIIALPVTNNLIQGKQIFDISRTALAPGSCSAGHLRIVVSKTSIGGKGYKCVGADSTHYTGPDGDAAACPIVETTRNGKEEHLQSVCLGIHGGINCEVEDDACNVLKDSTLKESDCLPGQCHATLNGAFLGVNEPNLETRACQTKCLNYPQ